jgi:TolA-binding protein
MEQDWIEIMVALGGGGFMQWIISTKLMPKKEVREADKIFIDQLLERVSYLEGKIDTLSAQLIEIVKENEQLKVELKHLRDGNN